MKVGDYIRIELNVLNTTRISKIKEIINDDLFDTDKGLWYVEDEDIIKSSPNIIDLIEVGDYVNGRYVDKYQGKLGNFCELPNGKWEFIELSNEHYLISSIVTKEQFKEMEYRIGDD